MGADFDASWANIAPRVELLTASAQLGAARNGISYVPRVLEQLGTPVAAHGLVNAQAFVGTASDGRPLGSLLEGAKIHAKRMNSLDAGGKWLDMAVHTQVQDAARGAASVAMAVRPGVGHVRVANPPCCGPCAVLSGAYSAPTAFKRHPRCDCFAVPSTDPRSMTMADPTIDQIRDLTEAERKALLEGSDLSRVINSRRGSKGLTTTELTGRGRFRGRARLTPDGIFAHTHGDRAESLRLLREHGYITDSPRTLRTGGTSIANRPAFGKILPSPDGRGPLKGHGPGRPLSADEWENADTNAADFDYRMISSEEDRATAILQYWCETEQWSKQVARNVRDGRDALDGIDFEKTSWTGKSVSDQFINEAYGLDDLKADISATGHRLAEWTDSRTGDVGTVYKGMNFDRELSWDEVISKIKGDGLSYSSFGSRKAAKLYAGRADRSRSVFWEIKNARGIQLDSVGNHASKTEALVSGDYEIVGTRIEQDPDGWGEVLIVEARPK